MVGQRLSPRHQLYSGLHQRRRFLRHLRIRDQGQGGNLRVDHLRHPDRSRRPAGLRRRSDIRRLRRSLSEASRSYWTGDNFGDIYLGAKVNFMSEADQKPAAVAARFMVKLPTASADNGIGTGKADFLVDFITSKELKKAEVSGYAGYAFLGSTDNFESAGRRVSMGRGRRVSVPGRISRHDGTGRHRQFQQHRDATRQARFPRRDGTFPPLTVNTEQPGAPDAGRDLSGTQGILRRRRRKLEFLDPGTSRPHAPRTTRFPAAITGTGRCGSVITLASGSTCRHRRRRHRRRRPRQHRRRCTSSRSARRLIRRRSKSGGHRPSRRHRRARSIAP